MAKFPNSPSYTGFHTPSRLEADIHDLEVEGEENNFVERTIRIRKIAEPRASAVKAELIAAIPAKRGRVT